jgi:hypothetical protein
MLGYKGLTDTKVCDTIPNPHIQDTKVWDRNKHSGGKGDWRS